MIIEGVRINYGVIDQTLQDDTITYETSSDSVYSELHNTTQNAVNFDKIAYLEKDYFLLDGTFIFPDTNGSYDVGWESASIADVNGNINDYIEYVFNNLHDSYGIQIIFPTDCAADTFTVEYFNGNSLVGANTVTGNTAVNYVNYDVRMQWDRVRITFTKVKPQQRARLLQIVFGINELYDEDMLISVSASRTTDLTGDYDDSGEFSFQYFNNGRFNVQSINDLPIGMQEGLKVVIYIKKRGSDEYVMFGNYYSENTSVEENGNVITVSGYDELYGLGESVYRNGIVYTDGRSLYDWAEEVAEDAGITLAVDDAFKDIISTGYITEVPHREALRLIAEAGNGILVIDAGGNISLKKHTPADKGELTTDDIVEGSYSVLNEDKYLGVNVTKYTFSAASSDIELGHLEEIGLTAEPQEIEIVYSTFPAIVDTIQVFVDTTGSAHIEKTKIYSDRCVITITGTDGDTSFVTVTGRPYNSAITSVTRGSTLKNVKTIENNYLITGDIADSVADYQNNRVVNKYQHTAEIVSDTDFELGDEIKINASNTALQRGEEKSQYVTSISFELSYEDNITNIEALDE